MKGVGMRMETTGGRIRVVCVGVTEGEWTVTGMDVQDGIVME